MGPHDDPRVTAALAVLEVEDLRLARRARTALGGLIGDSGLETITQQSLQWLLWYELPLKWHIDLEDRLAVADALGRLLRLLDLPRYAELCHSETTEEILRAYDRSHGEGFRAFRAAEQRSGVVPPDLPAGSDGYAGRAFAWGSLMGVEEAAAFGATAAALELAITAGQVRPGARGWRRAQQEVAGAFLRRPRTELGGASWLDTVLAERRQQWQRSRSPLRGDLLAAVLPRLEADDPAPPDTADAVARSAGCSRSPPTGRR